MKPAQKQKTRGFTLIELLVVIGIIGILIAVVLVAINPGRQFAQARDTQRRADLYSIVNTVYQYATSNNGNFPSGITTSPQNLGTGGLDLTADLVPTYIPSIPLDPTTGTAADTKYVLLKDVNNRIVASATGEITTIITVAR